MEMRLWHGRITERHTKYTYSKQADDGLRGSFAPGGSSGVTTGATVFVQLHHEASPLAMFPQVASSCDLFFFSAGVFTCINDAEETTVKCMIVEGLMHYGANCNA
jgi:hypothetical protein